jgi:hypothetical protein
LRLLTDDQWANLLVVFFLPRCFGESFATLLTIVEIAETPHMDDLTKRANFRTEISDQISQNLLLDR